VPEISTSILSLPRVVLNYQKLLDPLREGQWPLNATDNLLKSDRSFYVSLTIPEWF